jgi:cbb3-type cytochrome oxidase subunit 1
MKRQTEQLLERLFLGWLIIGVTGLVVALLGLLFRQDILYFVGLIIALPMFLFGLGLVLLVALMYIFGIVQILKWICLKCRRRVSSDNDKIKKEN